MRYFSTRDRTRSRPASLREAVFRGLAPDGGLYLPERLPPFPRNEMEAFRGAPFSEVAESVVAHLLGEELGRPEARAMAGEAFTFPVPVVEVDPELRIVELFHGPTGSFKDFGARFLAALLSRLREGEERIRILVATSGDTGGAVAHAVSGIPGVDVIVLFPEGRISPVQLRQIAGAPGVSEGSVRAVAVQGSFDDCQRMVKEALARPDAAGEGATLTTANSVNVGRLLPQIVYHVHAWAQHPASLPPPIVSVPSGNLGNLTAGVMAWRMGLPVAHFVAAMNENRPLVRSRLDPASRPTLSSAMDVVRPSNLERLLALFPGGWDALSLRVESSVHTDAEVIEATQRLHRDTGYLMDPHTAVGLLAARTPGLVLATADPAKFPEAVARATGEAPASLPESDGDTPAPGFVIPPRTDAFLELLQDP